MTPRASVVLVGRRHGSGPLALLERAKDFIECVAIPCLGPFDDHLSVFHLADLQVLLGLRRLAEQISDLLKIDLDVLDRELYTSLLGLLHLHDVAKDVLDGARDQSVHLLDLLGNHLLTAFFDCVHDRVGSQHSERLASTTLSVGENCAIEAVKQSLDRGKCSLVISGFLTRIRVEYFVESESLRLSFTCRRYY